MSSLANSSRIELPAGPTYLLPTLNFISSFAEQYGMHSEKQRHLRSATEHALSLVMKSNETGQSEFPIAIDVFEKEGSLYVEILNRGVPILLNGNGKSGTASGKSFHDEVAPHLDKLSIENLGRQGQTVVLAMQLGEAALKRSLDMSGVSLDPEHGLCGDVTIRELKSGEEAALSQLFYFVYGYNYINEAVYYPEKIKAMIEQGKLISIVGALPSGRLVGHVGLLKWADDPAVYEPCLGVVDPHLKSRGLFRQIFTSAMDRVSKTPMQYCFFDFVTNHDLSQKLVSRFGSCDLSIFVGCQSKITQAKLEKLGIGKDSLEMDRYSLLYSIIPQVKFPFGKEILLPMALGEGLDFLLKPLNLSWSPAPRFQLLPREGNYQTHFQTSQNAVVFDLVSPGRQSVEKIIKEWRSLLRNGYQYAAVEVPLDAPGIGNLYDMLSGEGFFISGFVPVHHSNRLGFRFQALGHTKVAWDDIKLFTPTAQKLLGLIRQSYERNSQ